MWQENPNYDSSAYVQPNATSGYYQGLEHSILVQRTIGDPTSCHRAFAQYGDEYNGNEIPIVLVPKGEFCNLLCCIPGISFAVAVPSGPYVLWQRWHRDMGELSPGVKWVWPFWKRISHIVTSAAITYNAPARNCPTADAVPVNVDLTLTFRIGPDAEAARKFVYRLGAHRFDEMLTAETEEAIRGLVFSVTHDQVNDLREEFAVGMKSVLNNKIEKYGVQILFVKITGTKTLQTVLTLIFLFVVRYCPFQSSRVVRHAIFVVRLHGRCCLALPTSTALAGYYCIQDKDGRDGKSSRESSPRSEG
mmetsp:Transcript_21341/g.32513  ORF Transcript_21341/g.32513 Transcript_21341/m.32513 type:complete len:305 (+) Transcript_21341:1966-2880(+)